MTSFIRHFYFGCSRLIATSVLIFSLFYIACTNLELGQTDKRFDENMKGDLQNYADFTVPTPNSFSFSVIGDTHIGSGGGYQLPKAVVASKADGDLFMVLAGDMTDGGEDGQYKTFLSVFAANGFPFYPCIGNHDIFFGGWKNYRNSIGRSMYSFNAGSVHLVIVDTANGQIGEKQLDWLEADLRQSTRQFKMVFMHYPPYVGSVGSIFQLSGEEETAVLKDMMNRYSVNVVFAGHYHGYLDSNIGNTRYVVTGGGNTILDTGNAHYMKVQISGGDLIISRKNL